MQRKSGTILTRSIILSIGLYLIFCIVPSLSSGDSATYVYDDLGRLRIVGNSSGSYAAYKYDAVGNLLAITTGTTSPNPPVIQGINPDVLFIGSTTTVSITGQNLLTTKALLTSNPHLGCLQAAMQGGM